MPNRNSALHINSYFLTNPIHGQFFYRIRQRRGDEAIIPVHDHFNRDLVPDDVHVDFLFNSFDRKFFFPKVWKVIFLFLKRKNHLKQFNYIHAHTLMSDGIPAYIISKIAKVPLVISVRNTDVTLFINRSRVFRWIGKRILSKSVAVFFISPSLRRKIEDNYPSIDSGKYYALPNGLDDFWLDTSSTKPRVVNSKEEVKLLFVGQIIPRKNLDVIITFLKTYTDKKYILSVVGENILKVNFRDVQESLAGENEIHYLGKITDKVTLRSVYDSHDVFVLLSHAETFGVVYIEAMSRGLPIVYSENEGLHGFFPEGKVGFACNNKSIEHLKTVLDKIIAKLSDMSNSATNTVAMFSWEKILDDYIIITKSIGNAES